MTQPQRDSPAVESAGEPTTLFGRYEVRKKLGAGAMGSVYLVRDAKLDRLVALKVPRLVGRPEVVGRFQREAQAAAALRHINICGIYDVDAGRVVQDGRERTVPYLTMEYVEGVPLSRVVEEAQGALTPGRAAAITVTLARALQVAHDAGVVHRDLKPANIMMRPDGQPVVMDFGLARRESDARITKSGAVVGTPAYMAPEQIRNEAVGPASDVYALGVILYQLLTGALPYEAEGAVSMLAHVLTQEPIPLTQRRPDLDPRLEAVCLRAMAKDAAQRFAAMTEFADALEEFAEQPATLLPGSTARRSPTRWLLAAVGVAGLAAAVWLAVAQPWRPGDAPSNAAPSAGGGPDKSTPPVAVSPLFRDGRTAELVRNGDCSEPNLAGWVKVSGNWVRAPFADPYFFAGVCPFATLRQDVDVRPIAREVDAGEVLLEVSVDIQCHGGANQRDTAQFRMEFWSAESEALGVGYDTGRVFEPKKWRKYRATRPAPRGTREVRLYLASFRSPGQGNRENSGYFDNVSLKAVLREAGR